MLFGIPDNYDVMEHMRFAVTYSDSLSNGDMLAVWSGKDNLGFGGAGVRLYPPLTYILLSVIHLFAGSWHLSLSILLLIGMLIGCLGVYRFTSEYFPNGYPLLASFVYAVIPYHLFQIYQVFLLAEFMAAAFTPFVFYYGTRLVRDGGIKNALLCSTFFSLVILSHIPSSIILSISLTIFLALQLRRDNLLRTAFYALISAVIALGATAFYWVKVITEVKWVKHDGVEYYNSGLYTYSAYLFPIILDPPSFYKLKLLWLFDIMIAISIIAFLFVTTYLLLRGRTNRLKASILLTAVVAITMTTVVSAPIWNNIEFLQKLQFPWRWLSVFTVMLSFLVSVFVETVKEQTGKISRALLYPTIAIVFVSSIFIITQILIPMAPLSPADFDREVNGLGATTGCKCWWPAWVKNEALNSTENVTSEGRNVSVEKWADTDKKFRIGEGTAPAARIAVFFYPYWKAEVNGKRVQIEGNGDGTINIPLPQETADVRIFFEEPDFLARSQTISLFVWAGLLAGIFFSRRKLALSEMP